MNPILGVCRRITATAASAGAGDTVVTLRPDAGKVWEVLMCYANQDDGAVATAWHWTDPDCADLYLSGKVAAGAGEKLHLGSANASGYDANLWGPPTLTYDRYLKFHFTASAAGKNGNIFALVREFRGIAREA